MVCPGAHTQDDPFAFGTCPGGQMIPGKVTGPCDPGPEGGVGRPHDPFGPGTWPGGQMVPGKLTGPSAPCVDMQRPPAPSTSPVRQDVVDSRWHIPLAPSKYPLAQVGAGATGSWAAPGGGAGGEGEGAGLGMLLPMIGILISSH